MATDDSIARFRDFHNRLRILMGIDLGELEEVGLHLTREAWETFRDHPWRAFIRMNDDDAAKVWAVIERRVAGR